VEQRRVPGGDGIDALGVVERLPAALRALGPLSGDGARARSLSPRLRRILVVLWPRIR
jgi:hypothetical protein